MNKEVLISFKGTKSNGGERDKIELYTEGKFYRDGAEVLTPLEEALKKNAEYEQAISEIEAALGVTT